MTRQSGTALVLGAGVQGVLVALMLAQRGEQVTLIDKNQAPLREASLNYEGRVHLGLIYAMDKSQATGRKMVQDALQFAPVVDRLVGQKLPWATLRSTPSRYFVHKDSHLNATELAQYYQVIQNAVLEGLEQPGLTYLGQRPDRIFAQRPLPAFARDGVVTACFDTAETCVDQPALNQILLQAVQAHPAITLCLTQRVTRILQQDSGDWDVICSDPQGTALRLRGRRVINCLWEERARFDAQVGLSGSAAETMRLKYSLMVRNSPAVQQLGSMILVHGAFGSLVTHPGAEAAFASWYPACQYGMRPVGEIPPDWQRACAGQFTPDELHRVWRDNMLGFQSAFPGFELPEPLYMKAGVILAEGHRDIDDRQSGYHRRDALPLRQNGSYVSVATGKYTSAPHNAALLEQMLFEG